MNEYIKISWKHILCIFALAAFQNSWAAGTRTARIIKWTPPASGNGAAFAGPATLTWTPAAATLNHAQTQVTFHLKNTGGTTTGVISVGLSPVYDMEGSIFSDACTGTTLAPGVTCDVVVELDTFWDAVDTLEADSPTSNAYATVTFSSS